MENFVQVNFKSLYSDGYGGRAYTYIADVPLEVGDVVKVPTATGESEAKVIRVNIPEEEARNGYRGEFRHIEESGTPGGSLFDDFFN